MISLQPNNLSNGSESSNFKGINKWEKRLNPNKTVHESEMWSRNTFVQGENVYESESIDVAHKQYLDSYNILSYQPDPSDNGLQSNEEESWCPQQFSANHVVHHKPTSQLEVNLNTTSKTS